MLKVLICGPREWVDQRPIEDVMGLLPRDAVIIHGGARGVDNIAGFVARLQRLTVRSYPVDHKLDGPWPAAGPRRNLRMLASESPYEPDGTLVDLGIAFKKSATFTTGTGNMASLMRSGDIPVLEPWYQRGSWPIQLESLRILLNEWL